MFGMSLPEILIIAIIAVLVLGPDKLPDAMVSIAKFFKTVKKGVNDAKATFDQEVKIAELKEDAKKYTQSITQATENVRKKLTFEELDEIKKGVSEATSGINDAIDGVKKSAKAVTDPVGAVKDAVLSDKDEKKEA
ncbi:preprotein translocase subunit TatB [Campylobacter mucosalis]|uniref:Sec-independent protein translocase protein TatB homolog n=1 Tax=Campylobacter mucosalis CCUG 21559 TaxID=1032067 RepID=A0A6G5QHL8_9BACT|nr:Sec-independent protein translocase protein TatB [Campylobacter mucosalis]KEA46446.1 preprotein translocase subunit TatB [Campylobacter mucosalis]QCD45151.1 twin arginine translocation system, TatB family protein [Campylobacter mucosalis CCUG 21559]QKF63067.1 twin arginine translocation system, TatB protein [Campylobacter mucosalis]